MSKGRRAFSWNIYSAMAFDGVVLRPTLRNFEYPYRRRLNRWHPCFFTVHPNFTAFAAQGDNQSAHLARRLGIAPTGPLTPRFSFLVIHDNPTDLFNESRQLLSVESLELLPRIKNKRNAGCHKLRSVMPHGLTPIRRIDAELHVTAGSDGGQMRQAIVCCS